jgi:hypothetical protein
MLLAPQKSATKDAAHTTDSKGMKKAATKTADALE